LTGGYTVGLETITTTVKVGSFLTLLFHVWYNSERYKK
jgi:hypothetical protein